MIDNWPKYFKDRLLLGNFNSNVGIVTLWTPKDTVASFLSPDSFCVCGQLYTKRGITPLLRNILANTNIRYLVICGNDRQGSGEALLKFFRNGFYYDEAALGWRIVEDPDTIIDKEIDKEALDRVREYVIVSDMRTDSFSEVAEFVQTVEPLENFGFDQEFPESKLMTVQRFPSDLSGFKIRRATIGEAWLDMLKTVNRFGVTVPGMYGNVKEVQNLIAIVDAEDPKFPLIPDFMNFDTSALDLYIKGFFEKDPGFESYTYGERIFAWDLVDQEKVMVEKLSRFEFDRGALAVLWKPHKDNFPPQNNDKVNLDGQTKGWSVPCLVMLLAQCLDGKLNLTAVFRNNDVYGAWPLNAFALRNFQGRLAEKIGRGIGSLTTIAHIAEIYEIDWENSAQTVLKNDNLGRTCTYDSRSYYTVEVEETNIIVKFYSPEGASQIAEFVEDGLRAKVARDLCNRAIQEMLISDLGAAADLGRQLAKAENAVKLGLKFRQDNLLSFGELPGSGVINLK